MTGSQRWSAIYDDVDGPPVRGSTQEFADSHGRAADLTQCIREVRGDFTRMMEFDGNLFRGEAACAVLLSLSSVRTHLEPVENIFASLEAILWHHYCQLSGLRTAMDEARQQAYAAWERAERARSAHTQAVTNATLAEQALDRARGALAWIEGQLQDLRVVGAQDPGTAEALESTAAARQREFTAARGDHASAQTTLASARRDLDAAATQLRRWRTGDDVNSWRRLRRAEDRLNGATARQVESLKLVGLPEDQEPWRMALATVGAFGAEMLRSIDEFPGNAWDAGAALIRGDYEEFQHHLRDALDGAIKLGSFISLGLSFASVALLPVAPPVAAVLYLMSQKVDIALVPLNAAHTQLTVDLYTSGAVHPETGQSVTESDVVLSYFGTSMSIIGAASPLPSLPHGQPAMSMVSIAQLEDISQGVIVVDKLIGFGADHAVSSVDQVVVPRPVVPPNDLGIPPLDLTRPSIPSVDELRVRTTAPDLIHQDLQCLDGELPRVNGGSRALLAAAP